MIFVLIMTVMMTLITGMIVPSEELEQVYQGDIQDKRCLGRLVFKFCQLSISIINGHLVKSRIYVKESTFAMILLPFLCFVLKQIKQTTS